LLTKLRIAHKRDLGSEQRPPIGLRQEKITSHDHDYDALPRASGRYNEKEKKKEKRKITEKREKTTTGRLELPRANPRDFSFIGQ
jgi:hypothetical protein